MSSNTSTNYDGLTRNTWPGTWSPSGNHPIVLDTEIRGSLQSITGYPGDRLTDIYGQRLQEGMMVYVSTTYTNGGYTRLGNSYYTYKLLTGEIRNNSTGLSPNAEGNWSLFSSGGSTGTQGLVGFTGSTGTQGLVGFTGSTGTQGVVGFTGSTGTQGIIGFTGSTGTQGVVGYTGSTGTQGEVGFTGSTGTQGLVGFTGSTGTQGLVGFTGSTGTQGLVGFTGSTGTQGLVGFTGSTGTQGVVGFTGSTGTQGVVGFTGSTGTQGVVGFTGSTGTQGEVGFTGSTGTQGLVGFTGSTGTQGVVGYVGSKGESSFTYGPTPPMTPVIGDRWFDTIVGAETVWTDDGDSSQWVEVAASGFVGRDGYTGSSGLGTRTTASGVTSSLTSGTTGNINITGFKGYNLYKIQVTTASWVRIYSSTAARSSDSSRSSGTDPASDAGVITEIITTSSKIVTLTPAVLGFNDETTPTTNVPIAVTNNSTVTTTITVILTMVKTEQ